MYCVKMSMVFTVSHFRNFRVFFVFSWFSWFSWFSCFSCSKNAQNGIHVFHAVSMSNHRFFMSNDTLFHVPTFSSFRQHQCEFVFSLISWKIIWLSNASSSIKILFDGHEFRVPFMFVLTRFHMWCCYHGPRNLLDTRIHHQAKVKAIH